MTWTNVNKPSTLSWNSVNPSGKEQYDQANLTYDDANTFYDGFNPSMWTDIPKPSGGTSFNVGPGNATGLIMSPTYPYARSGASDTWTRVPKPSP